MLRAEFPLERRARSRTDVSLQATVKSYGASEIQCRVANVSPMGALIVFDRPTSVATSIVLTIPDRWFVAECEVRHQSDNHAGVMFVSNRREALARFG